MKKLTQRMTKHNTPAKFRVWLNLGIIEAETGRDAINKGMELIREYTMTSPLIPAKDLKLEKLPA